MLSFLTPKKRSKEAFDIECERIVDVRTGKANEANERAFCLDCPVQETLESKISPGNPARYRITLTTAAFAMFPILYNSHFGKSHSIL